MFYIRADANSILGSGHVMRCLSIAKALRKIGQNTSFITADAEADELIHNHGFLSICLGSSYDRLEDEIDQLRGLIIKENITALLIDSYYVTPKYLLEINKLTKLSYMDDLNQFIYPVDILINYNIYAKRYKLKEKYSSKTKLLLGSSYFPLRDEFIRDSSEIHNTAKSVLITTGGADFYDMSSQILQYIHKNVKLDYLELHIVIGPLNKNKSKLEKLYKQYSNVFLHEKVTNMSELMRESDIAISAGGSTLYELCFCGVPTISFSYADNQREGTQEFDRQGFIYYAGDVRDDAPDCLNNIINKLQELCEDDLLRKELSLKMQGLVDEFGADRLAEHLLSI